MRLKATEHSIWVICFLVQGCLRIHLRNDYEQFFTLAEHANASVFRLLLRYGHLQESNHTVHIFSRTSTFRYTSTNSIYQMIPLITQWRSELLSLGKMYIV